MTDLASEYVSTDNEERIEKVMEKNAEQVDMIFSRYKYHVIKSALRSEGSRKLNLLDDVKNKDGQMILAKGTVQTEQSLRSYIGKLIKHNLEYPIEHYLDAIQPEAVQKIHTEMNQIAEALSKRGICDFENIKETIGAVVSNLRKNHTLLNRLAVLKGEYLTGFNESLAVAIIASSIGQELGYAFEERVNAFTAGIFHHIGELPLQHMFAKNKIPYEEVKKIKDHPVTGYFILDSKDISESVKNAVLKHHLFLDGSGYPSGLSLTDDDELAKLISISSSLITMCGRGKRSLPMALKLLDIYSRLKTRNGEKVSPLYERSFYEVLLKLNLSVIESAKKKDDFQLHEIRTLHNAYLKLRKINLELETLTVRIQAYVLENEISMEAQGDIDTLFDYASHMRNLTSDTKVIIGVDQLQSEPEMVSELVIDLEVIILELGHYISYFEKTIQSLMPFFENTPDNGVLKKASQILVQIRYQLPRRQVDAL